MEKKKFAAINIGSNAIRLLLANVYEFAEETVFKKASLVRVPVRLGQDAFSIGKISPAKEEKLVNSMMAFSHLISVHEPINFAACATSAMREATNSEEVVKRVFENSGIKINVIDGRAEAKVIYNNQIAERLDQKKDYLYIDVGGGSTEMAIFSKGLFVDSQSFKIGTVRILQEKAKPEEWQRMKEWVEERVPKDSNIEGIGSGGNINKLFKMSLTPDGMPMSIFKLKILYEEIKQYTYEERISQLSLNPDRADVIVPASEIYLTAVKASGIKQIHVPKIGLCDGIVKQLYKDHVEELSAPTAG